MTFIADLHIHSKYSRATAKNLDLENIYQAAQIKGISLVGTGDFTHPAWMAELETKLEPAEPGLFALKPEIARSLDALVPPACRSEVRFVLQAEISNIYKKADRVRKNHNLIFFPDLETAKRFNARLDAIGNIKSDGRPILGLDARDLLEITLETSDQGFLIPAHIWTPWFSMFGSKSGFDAIAQCFDDLADHIFACETGLSSDPPMNWRVRDLDRVSLISNSDAHSPGFLGRNASVFNTAMDFRAIRNALETRDLNAFHGTLDMYPHQGKYHYDGHRKCGVRLNPDQTAELGGICPECGKPLTLGVLYRVRELANRPEGVVPENRHPYQYVIPLADILSEIFEVGPKTKKVTGYYQKAVAALGPELAILREQSEEAIEAAGVPLLAEAVAKMRQGRIHIDPGFDGEFGKVNIFTREEKEQIQGEKHLLFTLPAKKAPKKSGTASKSRSKTTRETVGTADGNKSAKKGNTGAIKLRKKKAADTGDKGLIEGLNPEQAAAVTSGARAVLIQAGPGTGKTRTLTARIAWLVSRETVDPASILALTFTNKAARELTQRISTFLPQGGSGVTAATFHGFCLAMLKEYTGFQRGLMEDDLRLEIMGQALEAAGMPDLSPAVRAASARRSSAGPDKNRESAPKKRPGRQRTARQADHLISLCKQQLLGPGHDLSTVAGHTWPVLAQVYQAYDRACREREVADFEDLIFLAHEMLTRNDEVRDQILARFSHVFVDEYQDLNLGQYELVKVLGRAGHILVIGDPDQSIYGFRGSDNRFFNRFATDYPGCETIRLTHNYRSTQTILDASFQMMSGDDGDEERRIFSSLETAQKVVIQEAASEGAEAVAVGKMIEALVGGLSFLSMDTGMAGDGAKEYSFSDFAVLYRTRKACQIFARAFEKAGIPFQTVDLSSPFSLSGINEVLAGYRILLNRGTAGDEKLTAPWQSKPGGLLALTGEKGPIGAAAGPVPGTGPESRDLLVRLAREMGLADQIRADDKTCAIWRQLEDMAGAWPDPRAFLDRLALGRDPDYLDTGVEKVSLMTMHAAKGLEFPVVFVTGCENGNIPYARDGAVVEDEAEERRLFYVAMTRAMDILSLTYAKKRRIYGLEKKRKRSYFLDDIEKELARIERSAQAKSKKKTQEIQLELF